MWEYCIKIASCQLGGQLVESRGSLAKKANFLIISNVNL